MEKEKEIKNTETADGLWLIKFPFGILGFEDINEYTLTRHGEGPVYELCPTTGSYPKFIVFSVESIIPGYRPEIPEETIKSIGADSKKGVSYFAIAVVKDDISKTTVNLRSPLVVNFQTCLAAQAVLDNTGYSMRHLIFSSDGTVE